MKPTPIDLAHIVADGRPGGGTTMVLGLVDDLCADPALRITIVSQPGSYLEREVLRRGLAFVPFEFFGSMVDPSLAARLARALGARRFDITHVHGLRAAHHAAREPVRGRLGRLVYTNHGLHQLHLGGLVRWAANRAERRMLQHVAQAVFVSQADLAQARHWRLLPAGRRPAAVVWNGIDVAATRSLAGGSKDVDVAFVGRLAPQKQPLLAARVLAQLATAGWRCAMAGGGPLEGACRKLLRSVPGGPAVHWHGELSHDAALQLLGRTRIVLMPSAWEGLPILPMEAMALRTAVVGTEVPGIAEVVGDAGALAPISDAAALKRAAETILGDPAREHAMVQAGTQRAVDLFDRRITSRRYREIYAAVLDDDQNAR